MIGLIWPLPFVFLLLLLLLLFADPLVLLVPLDDTVGLTALFAFAMAAALIWWEVELVIIVVEAKSVLLLLSPR
jgi:hypothetical protein